MKDILREIITLNSHLKRLVDAVTPPSDLCDMDSFIAFRCAVVNGRLTLHGIPEPDPVRFAELIGIDDIIADLRANTEQFLRGLPCNNVLLYGPRGIGKSSAVKALLTEYAKWGLRMIEMPKPLLPQITALCGMLRDRAEKYIVFCDDLAFEEEDRSYRDIKSVLEGGLEVRPKNILFYATSNRRHLMPEKVAENLRDPIGELHPEDAQEEKISLSDRFGLRLGFSAFDADDFLKIVMNYADLRGIRMSRKQLRTEALRWSLNHGSFSGRTARQFIDSIEGRSRLRRR